MRRIAIIGSGVVGLIAGHALRKAGCDVTLYSDRSAEQWLTEARPTGTAARFPTAVAFERELGLDYWEAEAPKWQGFHMTFCPMVGNRLLSLTGLQVAPGLAIDVRLQSSRWMQELDKRGARVVVEPISLGRLDEIAGEHDLTLVAVGRGDLCRLFQRDATRSVYDTPQRHLAMVCVKGRPIRFDGYPADLIRFHALNKVGETFFVPYYHKDIGPSWNLVFEAKPGGPMDQFEGAKSGEEALSIAKRFVREVIPWDAAWLKDMELSDPNGWLVGKITPAVRKPWGRLPSGRPVMALGDTAMALDPLAAQGANNGNKMVKILVASVMAHGDRPFDETWMTATFEKFYSRHGHASVMLTSAMLEEVTPAALQLMIAQVGSDGRADSPSGQQAIANAFVNGFDDPATFAQILTSPQRVHALIETSTGRPWPVALARGALGVAIAQLRQLMGRAPGHPVE